MIAATLKERERVRSFSVTPHWPELVHLRYDQICRSSHAPTLKLKLQFCNELFPTCKIEIAIVQHWNLGVELIVVI